MLRQTIANTSRALRSTARAGAQRQLARPQFIQSPIAAAARTVAPRARWYSAEAEKKEAETKNGEEKAAEETEEAKLKKQLEAKEAEVRDWKVHTAIQPTPDYDPLHILTTIPGQVPPLRCRLPQPPGPDCP